MDKVIATVMSIGFAALIVLLCAQLAVNKQQQTTISALSHGYETCRHYNAVVNCNLAGLKDCEEKVKKMEEQAMDFVRRFEVK